MIRFLTFLAFVLLFITTHIPVVNAQSGSYQQAFNTKGLFVNAHASGTGMRVADDEDDGGIGYGAAIGYGINKITTIYVQGHISNMSVEDASTLEQIRGDTYRLAHLDLGVRFTGEVSQRGAVYGGGAVGGIAGSYDAQAVSSDAILQGLVATGELGFMYFLAPRVALDLGINLSAGQYSNLNVEGRTESVELDTLSVRLNGGLSVYPFR